ncbi:MAG: LysR family transcriptional regulator [Gammaproteobacteria bacterium]|uniref:DNA-binding transcriptional regulator, LysR family n=1 Tax=Pseudomonas cuatrocienegasensis TaxID=543360 RepID=A0ABY1BH04_9PSED|nr:MULTISPECIES: LysR family transcriptional regulator [Pseudomonas]MBU1330266.1 LysR family transcriptional regulator [Gammaproteobacteria bacterium]MBU1488675.1 LysR family transcriptional regulator [Gammaproteobacteria bacterium]MBU2065150.1 LysR family transcriptional regulator [Gammaproteobacteria bacterium]MBU2140140.1 LysR family transcriptional regulator [Gammaproteobacteria bacterium]MBU2216257.1 LysR family transcriptional regulator [Gammaproteobacteria bacterium]
MNWNLEQLRLFVQVAEQQSFSAVARQAQRAQSAVSNAIALLETDLGVLLFERSSGRQPRLTTAGASLLEEAREVLRQCERLDGRALGLVRGEEVLLRLAQDEAMPYQPVLDSLEALARQFPLLEVQLASGAQGEVACKLLERRADLGLLFHQEQMPNALERQRLGTVDMVTVCGVGHPLATAGHVDRRALARHRQLLMAPQYPGGEQISPAVWRTDSFYAMAELLMRNLGWAWLPRHVVQYPTYQGQLVELSSDWTPPPLVVELVCRRDEALGPAALWLAECFAQHLRANG